MSGESGGHYYYEDGRPCYSIIGKNGKERSVWITDAIALKLKPSVTTVTNELAKPGLYDYFVKEGAKHALEHPLQDGEDLELYLKRICAGSKLAAADAAKDGGLIHDACEQLVKTGKCPEKYRVHAEAAVAELHRLFPEVNDWIAEKSFAHPMGFGGRVDLHSPSTGIVVDYKTKPGDFSDGKRLAYDQYIQLAAYQQGLHLGERGPTFPQFTDCAAIFISRTHPGAVTSHVWSAEEIAAGWSVFEAALTLWKRLRGYDGSFA